MDKISSILPSSPRVQTVDLSDAHPIRPGTPELGRPVGATSSQRTQDRVSVSSKAKELLNNDTILAKSVKEDRGPKIADDVTRKFFETRMQTIKEAQAPAQQSNTAEVQDLANDAAELGEEAEAQAQMPAPNGANAGKPSLPGYTTGPKPMSSPQGQASALSVHA